MEGRHQRLTRKPSTGLPPGRRQMAGTATTLVISSQMVSIKASVPCGTGGNGSLLIRLFSSMFTYVWKEIAFELAFLLTNQKQGD